MFDSLLNSKFYNKCKHAIKCIRTRLDPIRRKKQAMLRFLKKDIADLLTNGLDSHAFGRMEGLIFEMNQVSCYDMIEQFCEYIVKQLNILQKQRDCPQEAMEAVSTLIFAAARFPDLPELCDLRHIFTDRYGIHIESFVSPEFVQKLQDKTFSHEEKLQVMQHIAEEFSVGFDTKALEQKLSGANETKHDLPKKGSFKRGEPALPALNGHKEDTRRERKSKPITVGSVQKQAVQLEPKDIHVIPNGIGRLHEKSRKQYSDKPDNMEPSDNFVSPSETKRRNSHKEVKKDDKKDGHPYKRALMDEEELDLNGPRKQEVDSMKSPEGEMNKIVPPYTKPRGAEKEDSLEKENGKSFGYYHRSRMASGPDYDGRHADNIGLKALGLEKQGIGSVNSFNGKTVNKVPPYTKLNGAGSKKSAEEANNGFLYDRSQYVADLEHSVQDRKPMLDNHMVPPYVKPKFNMRSAHEDPANKTTTDYNKHNGAKETYHIRDGLDDEVSRPISVRKKYAKPPLSVDAYDKAPDDEKITSRTPSGRRRHTSGWNGAYDDDYDQKGSYVQPQEGNGIGDAVGNGKHVNQTPSGRRRHTSRRNGAIYDDDYDEVIQHQEAEEDEMDSAIDFGNLLPRTASGRRRHRSRNTDYRNGGCDEDDRMMDKLLIHYSKKGLDSEERKIRTKTRAPPADKAADDNGAVVQHGEGRARSHRGGSMHPPERAVSLPTESVSPDEELNVPARSTSMQPDMFGPSGGRVHPRVPDYDELAARISALRKA